MDELAVVGLPFLTGSEENRGPLYDETGVPFEGRRLPVSTGGPQSFKIQAIRDNSGSFPPAVPLTSARVGNQAIVTVPGEMTAFMGSRLRTAVTRSGADDGLKRVVISGLANDFLQYFSSPDEFDRQHYEGGSTLYGRTSSVFIEEQLADLTDRMFSDRPGPEPYELDPTRGVSDEVARWDDGATEGAAEAQPSRSARRLGHPEFRWSGGPMGRDRPLDDPFVVIERRTKGEWRHVADDLGLRILWKADLNDTDGLYSAIWEPSRGQRTGRHRFTIRANNYTLHSDGFRLRRSRSLEPVLLSNQDGQADITLRYPAAVENTDLTERPTRVSRGRILVEVDGRRQRVRARRGIYTVRGRPGAKVTLARGTARDGHGNVNRRPLNFELAG